MTSTILRWVGSKRSMRPILGPVLEAALGDQSIYVEPFLGGGSIALSLSGRSMILNDLCAPLMALWQCLKRHPTALHARACRLLELRSEDHYYRIRAEFNAARSAPSSLEQCARFFYLNHQCFNGIYREGPNGYNVPTGHRITAAAPTLAAFQDVATTIASADLRCESAIDLLRSLIDAPRPLVVYADPPYDATYDGYGVGGFDADDQKNLAEVLRALSDHGHAVIATNADTLRVREFYAWAEVRAIDEARRISADGNRDSAACVLITSNCGERS